MKWKGQRWTGTPHCCCLGEIDMTARSASKDEKDKCSNVHISVFSQTLITQRCRRSHAKKTKLTTFFFFWKSVHQVGQSTLSNCRESTMPLNTECKVFSVFEGCIVLCTTEHCSSRVHSYHKLLIAHWSGRMLLSWVTEGLKRNKGRPAEPWPLIDVPCRQNVNKFIAKRENKLMVYFWCSDAPVRGEKINSHP